MICRPAVDARLLLLVTAASVSGCALLQLPAVCDVPADRELPVEALKAPNPFLELMKQSFAMLSARTLEETSAERVQMMSQWQVSFPSCLDYSNAPVPMYSRHPYGKLILKRAWAGTPGEAALSAACWKLRFRNTKEALFGDASLPLFCDTVDPQLVFDTTKQAEENKELVDSMRKEYGDFWAAGFGAAMADTAFYQYQFITPGLAILPELLVDELIEALPANYAERVRGFSVAIVYDTNVLFVRVNPTDKQVLVSAQVLRSAYALALEMVLPAVQRIRAEYDRVKGSPEAAEVFRDRAVELSAELSTQVLKEYGRLLMFVLAHELAHVYGAPAGQTSSEVIADCLGAANLVAWDMQEASEGLFRFIVDDFVERLGENWMEANSSLAATEKLLNREAMLRRWLNIGKLAGYDALQAQCVREGIQ